MPTLDRLLTGTRHASLPSYTGITGHVMGAIGRKQVTYRMHTHLQCVCIYDRRYEQDDYGIINYIQ